MATGAFVQVRPLSSLLLFSKSRLVHTLQQVCPVQLQVREGSTHSHSVGRLSLVVQQEKSADTARIKDHVAKYYFNRNPRSSELLGIADKPRGFKTWNRRVDYYHRYYYMQAVSSWGGGG